MADNLLGSSNNTSEPEKKSASDKAKTSGRFTPKGGPVSSAVSKSASAEVKSNEPKEPAYKSSGRFTKPVDRSALAAQETKMEITKPWVPWLMGLLMLGGGLLIVLNYVGVWPSSPSNWYLLGGILSITAGFMVATQLK